MGVTWTSEPLTRADLLAKVREHATEHYGDGGWDWIAEAYTDAELSAALGPRTRTLRGALRKLAPIVSVYADREADAENSRF